MGRGNHLGGRAVRYNCNPRAAYMGFSGSISYLLMKDGKTPLLWAARYAKSHKILTVLLKANANVDAKDNVSPGKMRLL